MSVTSDYNDLDLLAFGSGYLAMIKLYDSETKKYILDILELLTLNAMSYSWISVRAFYYYLARQVAQRRLEWNDIPAIRETAAVSFKHSDMRSAMVNSNRPSPTQQPNSRSNAGEEQPKGCRMGSTVVLALVRPALPLMPPFMSVGFANRLPILSKSAAYHMLHCLKRKMPISPQQ